MDYSSLINVIAASNPDNNIIDAIYRTINIMPQEVSHIGEKLSSPILYKKGNQTYLYGKQFETLNLPNFIKVYYYDPNLDISIFQNVVGVTMEDFIKEYSDHDFYSLLYQAFNAFDKAIINLRLAHGDLHGENILVVKIDQPIEIICNYVKLQTSYIPVFIDYDEMSIVESDSQAKNELYLTVINLYAEAQRLLYEYEKENEQDEEKEKGRERSPLLNIV